MHTNSKHFSKCTVCESTSAVDKKKKKRNTENAVNVKLSLQGEFVIKELQMPFFSFIPLGLRRKSPILTFVDKEGTPSKVKP